MISITLIKILIIQRVKIEILRVKTFVNARFFGFIFAVSISDCAQASLKYVTISPCQLHSCEVIRGSH